MPNSLQERLRRIEQEIKETGGYRTFDGVDMHIGYDAVRQQFLEMGGAGFVSEEPAAGYWQEVRGQQVFVAYTPAEIEAQRQALVAENNQREQAAISKVHEAEYRLECAEAQARRDAYGGGVDMSAVDAAWVQQYEAGLNPYASNYKGRAKERPGFGRIVKALVISQVICFIAIALICIWWQTPFTQFAAVLACGLGIAMTKTVAGIMR